MDRENCTTRSFLVVKHHYCDQIKDNYVGRTRGEHEEEKKYIGFGGKPGRNETAIKHMQM